MNTSEETEIKKEFQLERVILFSDAVFAIIITIMVLDIRLPDDLSKMDSLHVRHALRHLTPKIFAYGISFMLVSRFWRSHLKMFSLLKDYDSKLLSYNLLYLFSISLFPFGVSLMSSDVDPSSAQYTWFINIYVSIFLICTLTQILLAGYLVNNRHKLCFEADSLERLLKYKALRLGLYVIPAVIVAMIGLTYIGANPFYVIFALIFCMFLVKKKARNYYPEIENTGPVLLRLFRKRKTGTEART
jgi:uncharacterized membrane protein